MKHLILRVLVIMLLIDQAHAQQRCGTVQLTQDQLLSNPGLRSRIDSAERSTQRWIIENEQSRMRLVNSNPASYPLKSGNPSTQSLCSYDNSYYTSISAPVAVGQIVSPNTNCTYGGEYVTVTGLLAGNIYRISTCGVNNFDTQISIYTSGGGLAVAHNDDWCGVQSEIYFNPTISGNYDVLIDEYNCVSNSLCASLEVELVYTPRPVIIIPVVVHVIHFGESIGTGRNISDAQIFSQIDVLNEDFRRQNTDLGITPAAFRGSSDDPLVQFCLASQDEFGNPTNGIVRYLGTQASYSMTDMNQVVKPATIWDRDSYLNLWSVDLSGGLLGFAQFPGDIMPGDTPFTDGVVIKYNAFGRVGNVSPPYDLGRTATHEVGHWLDLRHIWGDEPACAQDDFVNDTPIQGAQNYGVPVFPLTDGCTGNYPGVLFYDYMDYSDDATLTMFTIGQAARMDAALFGPRLPLQSSLGCQSPLGIESQISPINPIRVFPNPSNGIVTVTLGNVCGQYEVKVINELGQQIYSYFSSNTSFTFDLNDQPNGVYFIQIITNNGFLNQKMILNK